MVGRILSFARGTGGLKQRLEIHALLSEVERLLKSALLRSIHLETKIAPDLPPILANSTQIHQVLMNLCINSRDAMPSGGDLLLSAQQIDLENYTSRWETQPISGEFVTISIADTGHGMTPKILDKIFEPF